MRGIWIFLTKKLGLVVSAISTKYLSPNKVVKYLKGKKKKTTTKKKTQSYEECSSGVSALLTKRG